MFYSVRMNAPTIGIGVLSWNAHKTLTQSLDSYRDNGFLDLFNERIIYFSDITDKDRAIAKQYGWQYVGGANEGIAGGMKNLAVNMMSDYVLLLQNDNPIVEDCTFAKRHILEAVELMEHKQCDLVRMRHRWQVGEGFADARKYIEYYGVQNASSEFIKREHGQLKSLSDDFVKKLKRFMRPTKAKRLRGRSIFVEDAPEKIFPDVVDKKDDFWVVNSSVLHFTDQCLLISRKLWLEMFVPYVENNQGSTRSSNGFKAPELVINGAWWRNSHFKIAQGQGLFTHNRFDGSFRDNHHTKINSK